MLLLKYLWFFVLCAILLIASLAQARDPAQVRAFRKMFPCPSTGKTTGKCEGWVVDHVVPLCWGGTDLPVNMQWQEVRQSYLKDRFEREACALKKKHAARIGGVDTDRPPPCYVYSRSKNKFMLTDKSQCTFETVE